MARPLPALLCMSLASSALGAPSTSRNGSHSGNGLPDFSLSLREVGASLGNRLADFSQKIDDAALRAPGPMTIGKLLLVENGLSDVSDELAPLVVQQSLFPNPVRGNAEEMLLQTDSALSEQLSRPDLFRRLGELASRAEARPQADRNLIDHWLTTQRDSGAGLGKAERARLLALRDRLDRLKVLFDRNCELLEAGDKIGGTPPSQSKAGRLERENIDAIREALELRNEWASLLGRPNFAHLAISDTILDRPSNVSAFLRETRRTLGGPLLEREGMDSAQWRRVALGKRRGGARHASLLDEPLFSPRSVVAGAFDLAEKIFGVRVSRLPGSFWHPDVRAYELRSETGALLGRFLLDLFDRPEKRGGPSATLLLDRRHNRDTWRAPVALVQSDLPGPRARWSPLDVGDWMHEAGHLFHQLLHKNPYPSLSWFGPGPGFSEVPAVVFELLSHSAEFLLEASRRSPGSARTLSRPAALNIENEWRFYMAYELLDSAGEAAVDLAFHTNVPLDLLANADRVLRRFSPQDPVHLLSRFDHIMDEAYAASVHAYLFAEVTAAGIVSRLAPGGKADAKLGRQYRRQILEEALKPGAQRLRDFLGRDPHPADLAPFLSPRPR